MPSTNSSISWAPWLSLLSTKYADSLSSQPFLRTLLLAYFAISSDLCSSFVSFYGSYLSSKYIASIQASFSHPWSLLTQGHSVNSCNTYCCVMFYSFCILRDLQSSSHRNNTWRLVLSYEYLALAWPMYLTAFLKLFWLRFASGLFYLYFCIPFLACCVAGGWSLMPSSPCSLALPLPHISICSLCLPAPLVLVLAPDLLLAVQLILDHQVF